MNHQGECRVSSKEITIFLAAQFSGFYSISTTYLGNPLKKLELTVGMPFLGFLSYLTSLIVYYCSWRLIFGHSGKGEDIKLGSMSATLFMESHPYLCYNPKKVLIT